MKKLCLSLLMLSLACLDTACAFNYEQSHISNSVLEWSAGWDASHEEVATAIRQVVQNTPGAYKVFYNYPDLVGEVRWQDSNGRGHKLSFLFNLAKGGVEKTNIFFSALYYTENSNHPSPIDPEARTRLQNLIDSIQMQLGSHAMKSVYGPTVR